MPIIPKSAPASTLAAMALAVLCVGPVVAQTHVYNLTQSYADANGGPALTPDGGTRDATGYNFGANQGLTLVGALGSLSNYSIDLVFDFASNNGTRGNGYQKIVDFLDKSSDTGLYDLNGDLNFYDIVTGPAVFTPGQTADVLITRNGATNVFTGYVNGVQQIQFTDTSGDAIFSSNTIHFFEDDNDTGNEAGPGLVKSITISAPEPSQYAAFGVGLLGLAASALRTHRRRTS